MKTPKGETITAFELHDAEAVSLIKMDLLSIEALDKIQECLNLLVEYGYIDDKGNLKDTYEAVIGIYNLVRDDPEMWNMVCEHKINALFQMEAQSGVRAIELAKPTSVDDLAVLNSALRLMAPEKGAEPPLDKFARFKKDISQWYKEMDDYGLTKQEQEVLEKIVGISCGLCIAQEQFMELVQLPECGGFDLQWADALRKSIAKKNPAAYNKLEEEFFQRVEERNLSRNFCNYVWRTLIAMNRGYGFNNAHTLAYSLIGLQEMNLAYRFPTVFWNCACLISDSGGGEVEDDNDEEIEDIYEYSDTMEDFIEDEDDDDEDDDEDEIEVKKKKKNNKTADYGRKYLKIRNKKSSYY